MSHPRLDESLPAAGNSLRAAMERAARRAVAHQIKTRARHYARRPMALETLYPGLAVAPPAMLIAVAEHLIERELSTPRRWAGFGGEVALLNAKAARLLGRVARRTAGADEPG